MLSPPALIRKSIRQNRKSNLRPRSGESIWPLQRYIFRPAMQEKETGNPPTANYTYMNDVDTSIC